MFNKGNKVRYIKCSSHGAGPIPLSSEGTVIRYIEHPETTKVVVDFGVYGISIVPKSTLELI